MNVGDEHSQSLWMNDQAGDRRRRRLAEDATLTSWWSAPASPGCRLLTSWPGSAAR